MHRLGLVPMGALLTLLIGGAWAYLVYMDWGAPQIDAGMDIWICRSMMIWNPADVALVFLMWSLMIAAMMLPSVLPVVFYVTRFDGSAHAAGFVAGYLLAWGGFSIAATLVQWALLKAALISPTLQSVSVPLSAGVLAVAGLFQFTALKHACLTRCRSPWGTVLRPSSFGAALGQGLGQGAFCVGCCWVLMGLVFVTGIMNLLWMVVITAYVIAEKWAPRAEWFSPAMGVLLCVAAAVELGFGAR
jgi:predicted metal-binding membrane protein